MITARDAIARLTSDSVMPPTPEWTTVTRTSSFDSLESAWTRASCEELALAEEGDLARLALVGQHGHFLARLRHIRQALDLDRDRRSRALHRAPGFIQHCPHAPEHRADQDNVAALQRSGLHQERRNRTAALVEPRLDHHAPRKCVHRRFELEHFGLQKHLFEQVVDTLACLGGHAYEGRLATVFLGNHAMTHELLPHLLGRRFGLVDLVERHDDRHSGRLRMVDGLDCLRHDAVVGRHHQHHDVSRFRAPRAHGREGFVTRRVEEGDHSALRFDVIGADVLRNAARLAGRNLGAADVVEQRSLPMVDVTHDGYHRRPRNLLRGLDFGVLGNVRLGVVGLGGLGLVTHLLDHDDRRFLVEHLVDGDHRAKFHQCLDDLGRFDRHLVRQLAH
jgi:hypothetical protein